jgi:predicted amidophosphoribosyltransferase
MRLQETTIFFQKDRYRHYYLCHYLPLCSGIDTVSRSLLKFKRGAQPDLDSWIDRTLRGFHETPVVLPPDTLIIRALRHKETRPIPDPPSSLDHLGQALSRQLHTPYLPHLLYKTRSTTVNQVLTRQQRTAELQNVYQIDSSALPAAKDAASTTPTSILLLDDILTTGATILSILQTLHNAFPNCTVTIFTLAKTL